MALKLIYISKNLNGDNGALAWLTSSSGDIPYNSVSNKYYHSLVFTQDNYLVTHGTIYDGHDTLTTPQDLENLGLYKSTGKINNQDVTVYAETASELPSSIFAPTTGGTTGQFLLSSGTTSTPTWVNLKDVLTKTTYNVTSNDPSNNYVLKYSTSNGLTWASDTNTTYKLVLNGTTKGSGSTSLGSFYAPVSAGTQYQILQADANGIPIWSTLIADIADTISEDNTVPTSYAVKNYVNDLISAAVTQAMVYKGTVASHTNLPANALNGDVYMFTGSGTYGTKNYKSGDTAIATVNNDVVTWEIIPSGNEQETFITVTTNGTTVVSGYDLATGNVRLGNAALKYYLTDTATISSNATSNNLVSAKQVSDYIASFGYTTNTGTVTSVDTGVGLSGGPITTTGTIKVKLDSEDPLSIPSVGGLYPIGVNSSGNLAVSIPWSNTTYTFAVGGSSATTNATTAVNDNVYVRYKPSSGSWANLFQIAEDSGIGISAVNGVITISNTEKNVTTSMLVGASNSTANAEVTTNGNLYLRLKEGNSYTNFNIVGTGATTVTSTGNGNITIDSINTWRPVYAYKLTNLGDSSTVGLEILNNITGTAALAFGSEFVYAEGDSDLNTNLVSEIHLGWAEVDASGSITYTI